MISILIPQLIVCAVVYFIGVFIGRASVKREARDNTSFDSNLIQHVSYDKDQCGYEK